MLGFKKWYKLKKNNLTVGYLRITDKNKTFYSIDNYGWTGSKIDYDHCNEFCGIHDRNNRPIFINDAIVINNLSKVTVHNDQYVVKKCVKNTIELHSISHDTNGQIVHINIDHLNKKNIQLIKTNTL